MGTTNENEIINIHEMELVCGIDNLKTLLLGYKLKYGENDVYILSLSMLNMVEEQFEKVLEEVLK